MLNPPARVVLMHELIRNLGKLHTTPMGAERVRRNLGLSDGDVVMVCRDMIGRADAKISRRGKNYYVDINNCVITVNAGSYTIITCHMH